MANILVIADEKEVFQQIRSCYSDDDEVICVDTIVAALEKLQRQRFDFVFIDITILEEAKDKSGFKSAMQPFWLLYPTIEIVVMSSPEKIREAVKAVKAGAGNYLTYPITVDQVKYVTEIIEESVLVQSELDYLRDQFWQADSQKLVKTNSPAMKEVFEKVRSVAPTVSTVLIQGETGTGKGVLAQIIHKHSKRSDAQFIRVHCGAIAETLIESELFGHEKGAFTGAMRRKLGRFEIAKEGTIFLDEIGTISMPAQIKLLQVLQERIFQRVGGEMDIEANVRIIAATNIDLKELCEKGEFRKDLFYRLNVFPIDIPPLRERKEDIPLLAENFIATLNKFHGKDIHDIHPRVLDAFYDYSWPGNIREMENLIERAYILETSSVLMPNSFPTELFSFPKELEKRLFQDTSKSLSKTRRIGVEIIEKTYLDQLLAVCNGKINETAAKAGITTRQLHKLMKKYGLRKESYKNP